MVKYEYDPLVEGFKRVDNRGKRLEINIVEARRIVALKNLGYKVPSIYRDIEMDLPSKISITTLRTFLNNFEMGNISIEGEFPTPKKIIDDLDNEFKFDALKGRVDELVNRLDEVVKRLDELEGNDAEISEKVSVWNRMRKLI